MATMRAILLSGFGGVDQLRLAEVAVPDPGPGELLVRVRASAANPVDIQTRRGDYRDAVTLPAVIGSDLSGVVEAVGAGVREFVSGDEVLAQARIFGGHGSYAQYSVVEAATAAHKPAGLSHQEAACLPIAGGTAYESLIRRGQLQVGETVLIHAAAGGVGSLAVQIARAAGARVFATCSERSLDFVRALGVDRAIDYRAEDVAAVVGDETGGQGVDLVLDTVGADTIARSAELLRPFGRTVTIVDIPTPQDLLPYWERNLAIHFVFLPPRRDTLEVLTRLVERRLLRPLIDEVLPLSRIADAHDRLERGGVRGKIVLDPDR